LADIHFDWLDFLAHDALSASELNVHDNRDGELRKALGLTEFGSQRSVWIAADMARIRCSEQRRHSFIKLRVTAIEHPRQRVPNSSWKLVGKRAVARSSFVTVASV
jgi:hypothetical protein